MKKIYIPLLLITLLISGCGQAVPPDTEDTPAALTAGAAVENILPKPPLSIVCTAFPQYDWVRQILGERIDEFKLTLLVNNLDFHNYQLSADDIINISTCDLFIYVGGESDGWVADVLKKSNNPDMIVINLMSLLDLADTHKPDEHVWLSLYNAAFFSSHITEAIISLDAVASKEYATNLAAYLSQISALDAQFQKAINDAGTLTLLCADRFPFQYLADDYGLTYYTAFPGCYAETEASFETIIHLAKKVDEYNLNNLIVTENSDQLIAQTIINNTASKNQTIHVLNSLQSINAREAEQETYLAIMAENLKVLAEVLK